MVPFRVRGPTCQYETGSILCELGVGPSRYQVPVLPHLACPTSSPILQGGRATRAARFLFGSGHTRPLAASQGRPFSRLSFDGQVVSGVRKGWLRLSRIFSVLGR